MLNRNQFVTSILLASTLAVTWCAKTPDEIAAHEREVAPRVELAKELMKEVQSGTATVLCGVVRKKYTLNHIIQNPYGVYSLSSESYIVSMDEIRHEVHAKELSKGTTIMNSEKDPLVAKVNIRKTVCGSPF